MSRKPHTPDNQPEVEAPTSAAVAEPPAVANDNAPAANDNQQSFVSRFVQRQRSTIPDPFGIATDYEAGVRIFESRQDRQMAFKFGEGRPEDKPSQAVIDMLKEAGYQWKPQDRIWAKPVRGDAATTRVEAGFLFDEIRQMIRQEKGLDTGMEVPF